MIMGYSQMDLLAAFLNGHPPEGSPGDENFMQLLNISMNFKPYFKVLVFKSAEAVFPKLFNHYDLKISEVG